MSAKDLFQRWQGLDNQDIAFAKLYGTMEANLVSLSEEKAKAAEVFFREVNKILEEEEKKGGK